MKGKQSPPAKPRQPIVPRESAHKNPGRVEPKPPGPKRDVPEIYFETYTIDNIFKLQQRRAQQRMRLFNAQEQKELRSRASVDQSAAKFVI